MRIADTSGLKEIGHEMLIPPALLQRIVAELASGEFIRTQAGRDGGITLARAPKEITLLQVVEQFEGDLYLSDCILKPNECPFESRCPVHCQWVRLKNLLRDEMSRITFEQLVEESKQADRNQFDEEHRFTRPPICFYIDQYSHPLRCCRMNKFLLSAAILWLPRFFEMIPIHLQKMKSSSGRHFMELQITQAAACRA